MNPQPKPVRELDPVYLAFVRTKPCCMIGRWSLIASRLTRHECSGSVEAHHVSPRTGIKSAASKVSDKRAVPVCVNAHREAEELPKSWLQFFNARIAELNQEFNRLYPDRKPRERKPRRPIVKSLKAWGIVHQGQIIGVNLNAVRPQSRIKNTDIVRVTIKADQ